MRVIEIYDEDSLPRQEHEVGLWTIQGNVSNPEGWILLLNEEEQLHLTQLQENLTEAWPSEKNNHSTEVFEKFFDEIVDFLSPISEIVQVIDPVLMKDLSYECYFEEDAYYPPIPYFEDHLSSGLQRPNFGPKQVRTLRGIKPGNILIQCNSIHNFKRKLLILSEPYSDRKNSREDALWYDYIDLNGSTVQSGSVLDVGVLPYNTGKWNPTNCLLRTGKKRLSTKQIAKMIYAVHQN